MAERLCRQILGINPQHPDAMHLLGLLAADARQIASAVSLIQRAIAVHANPDYYVNLGLILQGEGRLDEAISWSRQATALDPSHATAWTNLANQLRNAGQLRKAIETYETALPLAGNDPQLLSNYASALHADQQDGAAILVYQQALSLAPDEPGIHSNLGIAYQAQDNIDAAIQAYTEALRLDPAMVQAGCNLAALQLARGRSGEAIARTQAVLRVDPGNRSAMSLQIIAHTEAGDSQSAMRLLRLEQLVHTQALQFSADASGTGQDDALADLNRRLAQHILQHPTLAPDPAGKTTTGGQQTRNLLEGDTGPIVDLVQHINQAVNDYFQRLAAVGSDDHPYLAWQPAHWRLHIWATVLERGGHQRPHIHPDGWVSGVYYVCVPDEAVDEQREQSAGSLQFGHPPGQLKSTATPIIRTVLPVEGQLVLFPSYLYHSTVPFEGDRSRISIAFDVLPLDKPPVPVRTQDPSSDLDRARIALQQGKMDEATRLAEAMTQSAPDLAEGWHVLGQVAIRTADFAAASQHFARASGLAPEEVSHCRELANALRQEQRMGEALAAYEAGLLLAPHDVALLIARASLFTDMGMFEQASESYQQALATNPDSGAAHYGLAFVKTWRNDDPQIAALHESLAKGEALPESDRSLMHFTLGRAYDNLGDHEVAFRHFTAANAFKRRKVQFDLENEKANTERIIRAFSPSVFASREPRGTPAQHPVLIVGMPRSGTTLVEQILDSHPQIHGGGELNDLWRSISRIGPWLPANGQLPESVREVQEEGWRQVGEHYAGRLRALNPDALRITDKMPFNYTLLGLARMMMPNVRIIHVVRDPMDTCLSCYFTSFAADRGFTNDLREVGGTYLTYQNLMDHWRAILPGGILEVQYEELVDDIEGQARLMLEYLDVPWSEDCLAFHKNHRVVNTASHVQVRQPAYKSSVGRWRKYRHHLGPLRQALGLETTRRRR